GQKPKFETALWPEFGALEPLSGIERAKLPAKAVLQAACIPCVPRAKSTERKCAARKLALFFEQAFQIPQYGGGHINGRDSMQTRQTFCSDPDIARCGRTSIGLCKRPICLRQNA